MLLTTVIRGRRGSGKTYRLAEMLIDRALKSPESYHLAICGPMSEVLIAEVEKVLLDRGESVTARTPCAYGRDFEFENESVIMVRDDPGIKGRNVDTVAIEEFLITTTAPLSRIEAYVSLSGAKELIITETTHG